LFGVFCLFLFGVSRIVENSLSVIAPTNWPVIPVGIGDERKERINSRRLWYRAQLQILQD